ncbi:HlyC/CorC family transporter [Hydrogenovibrio kuenenii]|uniref:HlyC/CorC family transporter n=1 Tax=Hydrogenovibrio kuenenii TaxID=63658 RepID=UPI0004630C6B|nr:transporter associated domain-containing protein [Hydrogenovibrio kuenenii]
MSSDSSSGSSWLEKLAKIFTTEPESREDLETLLEDAQAQDLIEHDALVMIKGVLNVFDTRVRDVMVPKVQLSYVDEADPVDVILEKILESAHSRYPVFSADTDEVVGMLLAKDVLQAVTKHDLTNLSQLRELYRAPVMVSESKRLNVLLKEFKKSRNHMALVVDEYGELAGLVTIEDVLEEIVGDIEDEHDESEDNIQKHVSGGFLVEAITSLEDFNDFFKTELTDEQLETIGGLISKELGRIPLEDEMFEFSGLMFKVSKSDGRRVDNFIVTQPLETGGDSGESLASD